MWQNLRDGNLMMDVQNPIAPIMPVVEMEKMGNTEFHCYAKCG